MCIRIAIYMRLSKEDEGRVGESGSISMQRMLLYHYAEEHFFDYEVAEFADDGYTGTNFDRPGIKALLEEVKQSRIQCILVKDFSRFARDYIELGTYLEQIFPFLGVRFISVNDGYDSNGSLGSTPELDVNFKNLLYDLYSKDLSQKVRSSLAVKKGQGQYISANSPFGYEKSPYDRHMLLVEEDEAAVVRKIFALANAGHTSSQIAKLLNGEGIKTPLEFKIKKGKTTRVPKNGQFFWSAGMVCQILNNRVYSGDIVQGKYQKEYVGGKNKTVPKEQWLVSQNHHEPIIDPQLFWEIQNRRRQKNLPRTRAKKHPLTGTVICGCCGRNLNYRSNTQNPYFYCPYRYVNEKMECVQNVNGMFLEQYVLYQIQQQLEKKQAEGTPESLDEITTDVVGRWIDKIVASDEVTIKISWKKEQ